MVPICSLFPPDFLPSNFSLSLPVFLSKICPECPCCLTFKVLCVQNVLGVQMYAISSFLKKKIINLFIFGCAESALLHRPFFSSGEQGYSLIVLCGFSLQWFLLLWSTGSRAHGLQWLWPVGSVTGSTVGGTWA